MFGRRERSGFPAQKQIVLHSFTVWFPVPSSEAVAAEYEFNLRLLSPTVPALWGRAPHLAPTLENSRAYPARVLSGHHSKISLFAPCRPSPQRAAHTQHAAAVWVQPSTSLPRC